MDWLYFLAGVVIYQVLKLLVQAINRAVIERRQRRFLKLVNVEFPGRSKVTFIAVGASDKRAFARLERQLRQQFDLPDDNTGNGEHDFNNVIRREDTRYRDPPE